MPLTADIERALAEHRRWMTEVQHPGLPSGWIFPTWGAKAGKSEDRAGELHMGNPFNVALRRACEQAGIPRITAHGLRHTGNDLLRRFASREVVMSITGHSTPTMHSHYSHVDAGEKAAAVGKVIELVTRAKPEGKPSAASGRAAEAAARGIGPGPATAPAPELASAPEITADLAAEIAAIFDASRTSKTSQRGLERGLLESPTAEAAATG